MTHDEMRIAIAEAIGRCPHTEVEGWSIEDGNAYDYGFTCKRCGEDPHRSDLKLPNYPADLNACAEFEKTLSDDEWIIYEMHLKAICNVPLRHKSHRGFLNATAPQRCEAFLRTKGIIK